MDKLKMGKKYADFVKLKNTLMRSIANNSLTFFKVKNFDAESFIDTPISKKWAPRKSKKDDEGRRLLVKTGRGRQSINIKQISPNKALIVADAPYMKFHNDGAKYLPQRKFMGQSNKLDKESIEIINKKIRQIL
jgi:phage gpG-like protein